MVAVTEVVPLDRLGREQPHPPALCVAGVGFDGISQATRVPSEERVDDGVVLPECLRVVDDALAGVPTAHVQVEVETGPRFEQRPVAAHGDDRPVEGVVLAGEGTAGLITVDRA